MYKSPITIIDSFTESIIKQKDDAIFAEIQHSFGADVDKEELIRALQYDRNQYEKGYADGKADAMPKWIPVTERLPEEYADVLCCRGNHIGALIDVYTYQGDGKWEDSYGYWNYTDIEGITHWMPLPEAPKGD